MTSFQKQTHLEPNGHKITSRVNAQLVKHVTTGRIRRDVMCDCVNTPSDRAYTLLSVLPYHPAFKCRSRSTQASPNVPQTLATLSSMQARSASVQEPSLESYAPSGVTLPPPHGIAMQTSPLHIGITESVQFADAEYVVSTAAVATMVFPVKGIVEDIAVGSSTGAVAR